MQYIKCIIRSVNIYNAITKRYSHGREIFPSEKNTPNHMYVRAR